MNEMEMNSKVTNEQGFGGVAAPAEKAAAPAQRDLNTVTTEIQTLQRQAQQMALGYAVEIGRRLTEAKALVGYGEWGDYIKKKLGYSQSTANNLMRLFDAYGDRQIGLLGATADCQTFGNLSYSKALALLAVPEEEREEFAADHDVESMSTRKLQKAIQERDEAREALVTERELGDALREQVRAAEEIAETAKAEAEGRVQEAQKAAEDAAQALAAAKEELDALKNKPIDVAVEQPDPAAVDRLAEEKLAEAQKAHEEKVAELEKKLAAAEAAAKEAEEALKNAQDGAADLKAKAQAAAQAEVDDLRKKLAVAAPEVAAFQVHYDAAQREFTAMVETVDKLRREGHEKASGLHAALQALAKWATEVAG